MDNRINRKVQNGSQRWNVRSSKMSKRTFNPIRSIVDQMKVKPNPKKAIIPLSIGDPTVFEVLPPDPCIENAIIKSLKSRKNNGYGPSIGQLPAREAVANHYSCSEAPLTAKDVVLTSGCSGALELCISCLADPGQNVLTPRPGFSIYSTIAESIGVEIRRYDLKPDCCWEIDLDHMKSLIDSKTACIIINDPSNPCGSVYSKEHLLQILEVAQEYRLPLIADEIYQDFVFPNSQSYRIATLTQDVPILACGGISKSYLVPGWRVGWILIHDRHSAFQAEVHKGLICLSQKILGPNTVVQGALPDIFEETPKSFFTYSINIVKSNAELIFSILKSIPGLNPVMPHGAMYMMVGVDMDHFPGLKDDLDFTEALISEQSVFCLPGKCFNYPNYFRVVLTLPHYKMEEAGQRMREFCAEHYRDQARGSPCKNPKLY